MEINRCVNCMGEMQRGARRCPVCGFDNQNALQPGYALKLNSILYGRYLIGRVLGQGGFGIAYIGLDLALDFRVAIKEYFPMGMVMRQENSSDLLWSSSQTDDAQRQKGCSSFLKEARKMAKIKENPSIVRVRDTFLTNETAYIVMDFVAGTTLKKRVMEKGLMSESECLGILMPMMEGLEKVHRQGMIHRDISPDNIMIEPDGGVKLLDLGAAKDMTIINSQTSQVVAKRGFSPAEQYIAKGNVGPWTDVYALCATIYYCITGKVLPEAMERMYIQQDIPFPPSLSAQMAQTLRDGLAVRMEDRIKSVGELLQRLREGNAPSFAKEPYQKKTDYRMGQDGSFVREQRMDVGTGETQAAEIGDFVYDVNDDGNGVIIKRYKGSLQRFSIPERMNGLPVTKIDDYTFAFYECANFISIKIPSSVTAIGNHAFQNCVNLSSIKIPSSVRSIGNSAFRDCRSLRAVEIPSSVEKMGDNVFFGCSSLAEIRIPPLVRRIGNCAFEGCKNLASAEIPDTVESIGDGAFYDCRSLSAIRIPSSVKEIGGSAFANCVSLTEAVIPSSVSEIRGFTFSGCSSLKSVKIPASVKEIWRWAFSGCASLQTVEIPSSVREIWRGAFENCTSLREIEVSMNCVVDNGAVDFSVSVKRRW